MDKIARMIVTGHRGMVGGAIVRRLQVRCHDSLLQHTPGNLLDLNRIAAPGSERRVAPR
jgi:hypothetical protein